MPSVKDEREDRFSVSPQSVAAGGLIVALASLTTLVIVATVKSADVLSTVALGLAVLAFGAQLIQAFGQAIVSNRQYDQMTAVNTQAQQALAEIRLATGDALLRRDQHFERLMQTIIPSALAKSLVDHPDVTGKVDIDALSAQVVDAGMQQLQAQSEHDHIKSQKLSYDLDSLFADRPVSAETLRSMPASDQLEIWRVLSATGSSRLRVMSDAELRDYLMSIVGNKQSRPSKP